MTIISIKISLGNGCFCRITPGFCFISFEAELDNKTVKGFIKEKEEAKQEYIENKK
jgi:hypothetical protein